MSIVLCKCAGYTRWKALYTRVYEYRYNILKEILMAGNLGRDYSLQTIVGAYMKWVFFLLMLLFKQISYQMW